MKRLRIALLGGIGLISTAFAWQGAHFTLSSPDVHQGAKIASTFVFNGMGCTGNNQSPALQWSGAPAGTKSFAVTVYDPDAPTGSGWWHWVLYNIPANVTKIDRGHVPAGEKQGLTDFGSAGYGGPCPPTGDKPHHYIFTVYALKVASIDVPAHASAAYVGFNLNANKLAMAKLTALYNR